MKIEILKDKFLESVAIAEKFSSKHVSLPILSQILLSLENNFLTIKATNLDAGIEISFPVKTAEKWSVAIPPQSLRSFLSNTYHKSVSIEFNEGKLLLASPESSAVISATAPDDFPLIPKVSEGDNFSISSKVLVSGINAVSYSASVSSIKPELSSIYIYPSNEELLFVATDSFRLSEKRIKMPKKNIKNPILLPYKNALEIARVLDSYDGDVNVVASKNQVSFELDSIYISSRAVDGVFPDYKQIIPKTFITEVQILKEDFNKALKLTSGFIDSFQQVVMSVAPQSKSMSLKTKGGSQGEAVQTIKCSGSGEEITITFNHRYLADCLQSIQSDSISLKLVGANKPVIISESSHPSFTYLVMPMNR